MPPVLRLIGPSWKSLMAVHQPYAWPSMSPNTISPRPIADSSTPTMSILPTFATLVSGIVAMTAIAEAMAIGMLM